MPTFTPEELPAGRPWVLTSSKSLKNTVSARLKFVTQSAFSSTSVSWSGMICARGRPCYA